MHNLPQCDIPRNIVDFQSCHLSDYDNISSRLYVDCFTAKHRSVANYVFD